MSSVTGLDLPNLSSILGSSSFAPCLGVLRYPVVEAMLLWGSAAAAA
jgi:hypothetical protein